MNKIWILAIALLLTMDYIKAQTVETNNTVNHKQFGKTTKQPPFKITKGYYSIYRNAAKLNHQPARIIIDSSKVSNKYTKGFYTIGNNHTQLHKGGKNFIVTVPRQPLATKGYYSIKQPEEKLITDSTELD